MNRYIKEDSSILFADASFILECLHREKDKYNHTVYLPHGPARDITDMLTDLRLVSGLDQGIIHSDILHTHCIIQWVLVSPEKDYFLIKSTHLNFFLYSIKDVVKKGYNLKVFGRHFRCSELIKNALKVRFVKINNLLHLIFVSDSSQLVLINISTQESTILCQSRVVDFGWIAESELLVFEEDFRVNLFDLHTLKEVQKDYFHAYRVKEMIRSILFDFEWKTGISFIFHLFNYVCYYRIL
jgi:hypothetical protein